MINHPLIEPSRLPQEQAATGKSPPGPARKSPPARAPAPPPDPPGTGSPAEQVTFWVILVILFIVSAIAGYLLWVKLAVQSPWS